MKQGLLTKFFTKKESKTKIEPIKDIQAIQDFLNELQNDAVKLTEFFKQLQSLEQEYKVAKNDLLHINLQAQADLLDKIMPYYSSLAADSEINGLRLKLLATEFVKRARKAGMKDLAKDKKKSTAWWQW